MAKNNIKLGPVYKPPKVTFPSESIGRQFNAMHPSNVTNSLHGYYEASREDDFISKHPFGLSSDTHN